MWVLHIAHEFRSMKCSLKKFSETLVCLWRINMTLYAVLLTGTLTNWIVEKHRLNRAIGHWHWTWTEERWMLLGCLMKNLKASLQRNDWKTYWLDDFELYNCISYIIIYFFIHDRNLDFQKKNKIKPSSSSFCGLLVFSG